MGIKNPINSHSVYFMTLTVVDWVDIFTRPVYKNIVVDSLKHCQKNKGLEIFAWVLMTNHLHLVSRTKEGHHLTDFLRDFKKFTAKKIVESVKTINESRQEWIEHRFKYYIKFKEERNYQVWQEGNDAKELTNNYLLDQKIDYIHENPVRAGIVWEPEHYMHSSAIDYAGGKGLLDIVFP